MRMPKLLVLSASLAAGSAFAQSLVVDGKLRLTIDSVRRVAEYKQPPPQSAYVAGGGKEFVVIRLVPSCVEPEAACHVEGTYRASGYELRTVGGQKVLGMVVTAPGSGKWLEVLFQELPQGQQLESLSVKGASASLAPAKPAREDISQPSATEPPATPSDLGAVIALLKAGEATETQKQQLVGKWYKGTVTVKDVVTEKPADAAQMIVAVKEGSRGNQDNFVEMAFEIADEAVAARIKKGTQVTVTGRLVGTSLRRTRYMHIGDVEVFQFRSVKIAEPRVR